MDLLTLMLDMDAVTDMVELMLMPTVSEDSDKDVDLEDTDMLTLMLEPDTDKDVDLEDTDMLTLMLEPDTDMPHKHTTTHPTDWMQDQIAIST